MTTVPWYPTHTCSGELETEIRDKDLCRPPTYSSPQFDLYTRVKDRHYNAMLDRGHHHPRI